MTSRGRNLVGQNIRICRMQRKLSQTDVGDQIGVTFQQIQKYENGTNRVGASRLVQIAEMLGVSLTTLFDGNPSSPLGIAGVLAADADRGINDLALRVASIPVRLAQPAQCTLTVQRRSMAGESQGRSRAQEGYPVGAAASFGRLSQRRARTAGWVAAGRRVGSQSS